MVARIATERRPEDGRHAYNRVVLIVPRRAGKTYLVLLALLAAALETRARGFYASHRRETAAAMWRDEWFPQLEASPLDRYVDLRRANGSETITLRSTSSTIRLLPADGDAARSFRSHLAMLDEAREMTDEQGADLEAGIFPTQATGAGGQSGSCPTPGPPRRRGSEDGATAGSPPSTPAVPTASPCSNGPRIPTPTATTPRRGSPRTPDSDTTSCWTPSTPITRQ
jgi:hypothetical protein